MITFLTIYLMGLFPAFWFSIKLAVMWDFGDDEARGLVACVTLLWPLALPAIAGGAVGRKLVTLIDALIEDERSKKPHDPIQTIKYTRNPI